VIYSSYKHLFRTLTGEYFPQILSNLIFQGFLLLLPFKVAGNTILLDSRERPESKEAEIVVDPTRAMFALVGNPLLKKNGFIKV
jgi:hypothetical protein